MKPLHLVRAAIIAVLLHSEPAWVCSATTCIALPPLKPIHRICGIVFLPSGDRVYRAKVTLLQGGKEIAVQETGDDGKFSFGQSKPGSYEIQVRTEAFGVAAAQIFLVHPESNPKQEIAVSMSVSGCSSFSLVHAKKFEAGLTPIDSQ